MSIIKNHFPYIAQYLGFGHSISFNADSAEVDTFSSKTTLPLSPSYLETPQLPEPIKNLPKKAIRWLLRNGYVPSITDKKITFEPSIPSVSLAPRVLRTLEGHKNVVYCVRVLSNGNIASASFDHTIKIWNPSTGVCVYTLEGHTAEVYSIIQLPNGNLASASKDKTIKIWNPETGECLRTLVGHMGHVFSLAVLPNGTLASGGGDRDVKIWDLEVGSCLRTLEGHSSTIFSIIVLRNGKLASCSADKTIKIWDTSTGICQSSTRAYSEGISLMLGISDGHSNTVWSIVELPDGTLASCSGDNTIKIWDLSTGKCLRTLKGHLKDVYSLVLLRDGTLASGSLDKTIKLWNPLTGECLQTITGHTSYVSCLAAMPDGTLVSGSYDKTIKISKIFAASSVPVSVDQILLHCDQAIRQLTLKILEDDNSADQNLICPLTHELFVDPVIIDDQGHTFERTELFKHLAIKNDCPTCPGRLHEKRLEEILHRRKVQGARCRQPLLGVGEAGQRRNFPYEEFMQVFFRAIALPTCRAPIKEEDIKSPKPNRIAKDLADNIRAKPPIPILTKDLKQVDFNTAATYLKIADGFILDRKHAAAIKSCTDAFTYSNRSEDYAVLPLLYEVNDEPLKAALAYLYLLKYQLQEGHVDLAKATLQNVSRLGSSSRAASKIKAMTAAFLRREGNTHKAYALYLELAEASPKEEALVYLEQALQCNPETPEIYDKLAPLYDDARKVHLYLLALIHLYPINREKAESYYQEARKLNPKTPLVPLAYVSLLKKKVIPGRAGFDAVDADIPVSQKVLIYRILADLFIEQKTPQAAIAFLRKALRGEEDKDFRRYILALLQLERHQEIEKVYLKWSAIVRPAFGEISCGFGQKKEYPSTIIKEGIKTIGETVPLLERLLTLYSEDNNPALKEIALKLGALYEREKKPHEAMRVNMLAYNTLKDFDAGIRWADLLSQNKPAESFQIYYNVTQEAFLKQQYAQVQIGLKKIFDLKAGAAHLTEQQTQFLFVAGMVERLMAQNQQLLTLNQELTSKVEGLTQEMQKLKPSPSFTFAAPVLPAPTSQLFSAPPFSPSFPVKSSQLSLGLNGNSKLEIMDAKWVLEMKLIREISTKNLSPYLALLSDNTLASVGRTLEVCNSLTGECVRRFKSLKNANSLAVLPDDTIISGTAGEKNTILFRNPSTGECLRILEGHSDIIRALAVLPKEILASASEDHTIRLWNYQTSECLHILEGHTGPVYSLAVLSDGKLASGSQDGSIRIWDSSTGRCLRVLIEKAKPSSDHVLIEKANFFSNPLQLSGFSFAYILPKKQEIASDNIFVIKAMDNGLLVSGYDDGLIKIWNPLTGECVRTLVGHSKAVFSLVEMPNGPLVSGSEDNSIKIWNPSTGECLRTLEGNPTTVESLAVLPGQILASSSGNTIKLWGIPSKDSSVRLKELP